MKPNYYAQHQKNLELFKLKIQDRLKEKVRIFDRHVGLFYTKNGNSIKINEKGMADLYLILNSPHGLIHVEIEIKTGNARQSTVQKNWQKFIESMGGLYFVVKDIEKDTQKVLNELENRNYIN